MGELAILNEKGDEKILWDINNKDATKEAERQFQNYKDKGFMFFSVDAKGNQLGELTKFDPLAETIICVPKVRKG